MTPIKLTHDFINKVRYTCQKISQVEWSGVLIYQVTNPDASIEELDITVIDFYPMSKDTKAHTDFEYGIEFLEYMEEQGYTDTCRTGLIHSHNTMGVFFSGEDLSELKDNTGSHSYYLSLIVNNNLDFCAKIAQQVESKKEYIYTTVSGKKVSVAQTPKTEIITIDCQIVIPHINKSFLDRLEEIIKEADARPAPALPAFTPNSSYSPRTLPKYDAWEDPDFHKKAGKQTSLFQEEALPSFEEFVKIYVLGVRHSDALLSTACREYVHIDGFADEIVGEYEEIYGRNKTVQEDNNLLKKIITLISPYANKDINKLIKEIKAEIKSNEETL